jgi:hypothetical protein
MRVLDDRRLALFSAAVIGLLVLAARPAEAVDWSGVKGTDITLFYPGQSSWEWILTPYEHDGAEKFRGGKDCIECHKGEEKDMGTEIVSGKKLEPDPIAGLPATIKLNIKATHDDERLYVRLEWAEPTGSVARKLEDKYESMATMMLGDGKVVGFRRGGCWATCHNDLIGMPDAKSGADLTKYLTESRTKITHSGGDENYKSQGDLDKLMNQGVFLEYWHAGLNKGQAPVPVDGYILDKMHQNKSPAISAEGGFENGNWVVVFSRKLKMGEPGRKDIVPGTVYGVGFAIHSKWAGHRHHDVAFRRTLVLDKGEADIVATKQ